MSLLLRRCAVAAVVVIGLTACQEDVPTRPATPIEAASAMPVYWKTAPTTDDQRLEILRRVRAIDPCALVPRADLTKVGKLLTIETRGPSSCEATFDSTESGKGTSISWSIGVAPTGYGWTEATRQQVDGITVGVLDDLRGAPPREGLLDRTCLATAAFANTVTLPVTVRTPLGTEPCPAAQTALARAMGGLATEPPQGTSPDTARTVLHGKDPCDVAKPLGATVSVLDSRVWSCQLTVGGATVDIDYEYEYQDLVVMDKTLFVVNGHTAYGAGQTGGDYVSYAAVVGPTLSGPGSAILGPRVPGVRAFGADPATVEAALRATVTLFPAT